MPATSENPERTGSQLAISPLSGQAGLRLAGEVDLTNCDQLRRALAALPADDITAVHLDVSGLCFIDVAGTRELIALMQSHPRLRLILHNPPASLRRIIALLWPGAAIEIGISNPDGGWPGDGQDLY